MLELDAVMENITDHKPDKITIIWALYLILRKGGRCNQEIGNLLKYRIPGTTYGRAMGHRYRLEQCTKPITVAELLNLRRFKSSLEVLSALSGDP